MGGPMGGGGVKISRIFPFPPPISLFLSRGSSGGIVVAVQIHDPPKVPVWGFLGSFREIPREARTGTLGGSWP